MQQTPSKTMVTDFTTGPVLKAMLTFAIPLFLSNLLQAVYNVVDMVVVGRVMGEIGLSGLSTGGDVLSFLTFISMGFSGAAQVIISQYLGAGLRERVSRFIGTMATFMFLCAVGMSVLCLLLRNQILGWLNTPAESWNQAMSYSVTCMFGLIFIYGYNIVSAIMRGLGDSKRPFMFISIAAVLNLLLDILFVVGFHWEAFGAALATVIAQGVSFLTSLFYLYKKREKFGFDLTIKNFRIDGKELLNLIKLGVPSALGTASILVSKLFVTSWINSYGVTVSAVTGAGHKVDMFANMMFIAVSTAGNSMVGQNIGAGKFDRVSRVLGAAFFLNCISGGIMLVLVTLFPREIFSIFTSEADVLEVCMEYVPVCVVSICGSSLRGAMNSFNLGCGNSKFNLASAVMDGIVARIALTLLLGLGMGLGYFGFWMGNSIAGFVPLLMGIVFYLSGRWKKTSSIVSE